MKKTYSLNRMKAFQLVGKMNKAERTRFRTYLSSGILGEKGNVNLTYEFLLKHEKGIQLEKIQIEALMAHLYPDKKGTEGSIKQVLTRLSSAIKAFWYLEVVYQKREESLDLRERVERKIKLLEILESKKLDMEFQHEFKKIQSMLADAPLDGIYHFFRSQLHKLEAEHQMRVNPRQPRPELGRAKTSLTHFWAQEKARIDATITNQIVIAGGHIYQNGNHSAYSPGDSQEVDKLALFYLEYAELEKTQTDFNWQKLRALFEDIYLKLSREVLFEVMGLLINFAARAYNQGKAGYRSELWQIYILVLKEPFLWEHPNSLPGHLVNLTQLATRMEEFEVLDEILTHRASLMSEVIEPATINLIHGILEMSRKNYSEATRRLINCWHHSQNQAEKLIARTRILIIYYETKDWDLLDSSLNALKGKVHRLQSKKNIDSLHYRNFVKFLRYLKDLVIDHEGGVKICPKLKKRFTEMKACKELLQKEWLTEAYRVLETTAKCK